MGRIVELPQGLDRIGLERAVEDEEADEREAALDLVARQLVDLRPCQPAPSQQHAPRTFSADMLSVSRKPRASTLLPRLV